MSLALSPMEAGIEGISPYASAVEKNAFASALLKKHGFSVRTGQPLKRTRQTEEVANVWTTFPSPFAEEDTWFALDARGFTSVEEDEGYAPAGATDVSVGLDHDGAEQLGLYFGSFVVPHFDDSSSGRHSTTLGGMLKTGITIEAIEGMDSPS